VLARVAQFSYRRRGLVVIAWIAIIVGVSAVGWGALGPNFRTDFNLPASETRQVFDFLRERSPSDGGFNGQIVFTAPQGVADPAVSESMQAVFERVDALEGVDVISPYADAGKFEAEETVAEARAKKRWALF